MQDKIQVLFTPGSYGTYLAWAVYSYSNLNKSGVVNLPFTTHGSSHLYRNTPGYYQVHPAPTHDIVAGFENFIFIVPTNFLEYIDNQYSKNIDITNNSSINLLIPDANNKLTAGWNNKSDSWVQRELVSFYIADIFRSIEQIFTEKRKILNNCKNTIELYSDDILFNFCSSLDKIFKKFNLRYTIPLEIIQENHQTYMAMQDFVNRDTLINNIVNAVISREHCTIPLLTLVDEARIQGLLRSAGLEIRCHNLNIFPTTTSELINLTYKSD